MSRKISRRAFIKLVAGAAITAIGLGALGYHLGWFGRKEPSLEREVKPNPYVKNGRSLVSIIKGHDVDKMVRTSVEAIGGIDKIVKPNSKVLIKPNVGFNDINAVASPEVVRAVVELVQDANPKEIIMAESGVRGYDTSDNFEATGIADVAKELNVDLINLDKTGKVVRVKTKGGKTLKEVKAFKQAYDADVIICIPKLKRHSEATVTISLKNMMGIIPDDQKGRFHELNLHQCIADLNSVFRPNLVIVDAIEVMTVSGPRRGKMIPGNAILASGDPVAVDVIAAEYLFKLEGHISPLKAALNVAHIRLAAELGVGTNDISKIEVIERKVG